MHVALDLEPPQGRITWRYVDLAKYLHLLLTRTLYFASPSEFADQHEGFLPDAVASEFATRLEERATWEKTIRAEIETIIPELCGKMQPGSFLVEASDAIAKLDAARNSCRACCWHMLDHESDAMWRLYVPSGQGIAIRSNVDRLRSSFPREPRITVHPVTYLDFDRDVPVIDDHTPDYFLLLLKRNAFRHECELRLIVYSPDKETTDRGQYVKCTLSTLVDWVVVAPQASDWVWETIESITAKLAPGVTVKPSSLAKGPVRLKPIDW